MWQSAMLDALSAGGPVHDLADELEMFGRFVGSWEFDWRGQRDGEWRAAVGEWHFGWILQGRAVQDVWIVPRRADPDPGYGYGTTMRFPDPESGSWRVVWVNPARGVVYRFVARAVGDEIVMEAVDEGDDLSRWVFSDITDNSFTWRGISSTDEGRTWVVDEEMFVRRRF